jgi:hypothetical protein
MILPLLLGVLFPTFSASQDVQGAAEIVTDEVASARAISLPDLTLENLPAWSEHIKLDADELGFEAIPWIASFQAGVYASSKQGKPLLFWAMNGHPLGCT